MRLALAALFVGLVVAIAALGATSCSIDHRSDQYACTTTTDCAEGRVCDNGYCIIAGSIDAPRSDGRPGGDATGCPAPCTSCNLQQKTCTVNCQHADCSDPLTCPAGFRCDIQCNTENACRSGIDCRQAASCNIECAGRQACEDVICGPGPCDVGCSGPSSCRDVSCSNSCACDVTCTGNQSCQSGIQCTSLACRSAGGSGCTSVPAFCNSCN